MKFDLTDDQATIEQTARDVIAAQLSDERRRSHIEARTADGPLWDELRELGFAGMAIDPEYGGQGLGLLELGLVTEVVGYTLAPVPLLANAGAALLVEHTGSDAQKAELLPGLADGGKPGSFASGPGGTDPLAIDPAIDGGPLVIVDGNAAVIAGDEVRRETIETVDLLRRYARITPGADNQELPGAAAPALAMIQLLISAELTGVAQRALDLAVDYAKDREQFGRKIGTFQGVSHRCASMLVDVETARSTWRYGTWVAANAPDELPLAAATAKAAAIAAADHVANGSLQVHGGIGFTWEAEVHLLLRRARTMSQVLGGAAVHRRRIAELLTAAGQTVAATPLGEA